MAKPRSKSPDPHERVDLRIIGGHFRGRKLRHELFWEGGDPTTRPMKDRVREAIFNLVGTEVKGLHAIDLFAGTGALGLEALSRGAGSATFIEKHVPTSRVVQENIETLDVKDRTTLLTTSAFLWCKRDLPKWKAESGKGNGAEDASFGIPISPFPRPWLVFCSPPYAFYLERTEDLIELLTGIQNCAPPGSIVVVEADERFDSEQLPGRVVVNKHDTGWDVRTYPPAVVGIWRNY